MSEQNKRNHQAPRRMQKSVGMSGSFNQPVEKAKNFWGTIKRLFGELKPVRFRLYLVIAVTITACGLTVLAPKVLAGAVNLIASAFGGQQIEFSRVQSLLIIALALYAVSSCLDMVASFTMATVSQRTIFNLRNNVAKKLTTLPLKYYDSRPNGEILARTTSDIGSIAHTISQILTQLINCVILIVGITIMMFTIDWRVTLIVLASCPISLLLMKLVMRVSQKSFADNQQHMADLNGHVEEIFSGHQVVKAFGYEEQAQAQFEKHNENLYKTGYKSQFISGLMFPAMDFIKNFFYVIVCVVGMVILSSGNTLSIGEVVALVQYSGQFQQPFSQFARIINFLQATVASGERVYELLDEEQQKADSENALTIDRALGDVAFSDVDFGYTENLLMQKLNISIAKGQTAAIVGPTGAGKTTLVNLLMRFYDISGGKITLDGIDITELTRDSLRGNIGMVLQDTWLFDGTIRENIAYGLQDATDEQIKKASWAAQAHRFIKTLPLGYDTVISEHGANLSQGQRQLLTIARAILADPPIIILDEATSSVDTITEMHIQSAMAELMKGRTCFVIAHRLSTIKNADLILVMNKGEIIEQGNHEQLMDKNGFYCNLYNSQFAEEL